MKKKKHVRFPILLKVLLLGVVTSFVTSTAAIFINYNHSINKARNDLDVAANEALTFAHNQFNPDDESYINIASFQYVKDYVMDIYNNVDKVKNAKLSNYQSFEEYENVFIESFPYFYTKGAFMTRDYPEFKQNYNAINQILLNASFYSDQVSFFAVKDPLDPNKLVFICDSRVATLNGKGTYYHCPGSSYRIKESDETFDIGQEFITGYKLDSYYTRYIEIKNRNDETNELDVIGYMFVEYETSRVYSELQPVLLSDILITSLTSLAIIILYLLLSYLVFVRNINRLNKAAVAASDKLGNNEQFEVVDPNVTSHDEINTLSESFVRLEKQLINYVDIIKADARDKERMNAELEIASKIQLGALPKASYDDKQISIRSYIKAAKEVGGDFYDYFYLNSDEIVLIISDVSGKGIPASLFMMKSKELIRSKLLGGTSLTNAIKEVNEILASNNEECLFVTAFIGVINFAKKVIRYVNAGHEKPYIISKRDIIKLDGESNYVLGAVNGVNFIEESHAFNKGDIIFMFTDGLNESIDENRNEFSYSRIENTLNNSLGLSLDKYISSMNEALNSFTSGLEQFDDITMMIASFNDGSLKLSYEGKDPHIITDIVDRFNETFVELDEEIKPKVGVIIDELINNYISYEKRDDLKIDVSFLNKGSGLFIEIVTNGMDFNPFEVSNNKYLQEYSDDIEAGGFGISIVKDLAKSTSYEYKDDHSHVIIEL